MKREIILMALTAPHAYPWERKLKCSRDEINKVLNEVGLKTEHERRISGWKLALATYKAGKKTNSMSEFKRLILEYCSQYKWNNEEVLREYLNMKYLSKEETIVILNKFMNNQLSELEKKNRRRDITYWLVDVVGFYVVSEPIEGNKSEYITNKIKEIASIHFPMYNPLGWVGDIQSKKALHRKNVIELLHEFLKKQQEIKELLASYTEEKPDVIAEVVMSTSSENGLLDLFDALGIGETETNEEVATTEEEIVEEKEETQENQEIQENQEVQEVGQVEEVVTQPEMVEEEIENIEEESEEPKVAVGVMPSYSRMMECVEGMADELGYALHKKGDYTFSTTEYEIMMQEKKLAEIKLFKQMAKLEQGAILSELYNAYTQIEAISKENLEAILGNFFMALEEAGLQVIEEGSKVGEAVTVNTADVLKDFIFSKPYNKDGVVQGTLLYKGWSYKNEQIMPKVVAPKMIEEEK